MSSTTMENTQICSRMSKVERLNTRVAKLLTVAVHEVLEVVRETVSEYQEKTARTQRENERLRRRLRDALARLDREREATRQASISLAVDRVAQRCEPAWGSDTGQDPEPGEARQRGVNAELRRAQRGQQREEAEQRVEEAGQSQSAADLETVCDLSVALTLAEQKWTAAEDGGSRVINEQAPEDGGGYQALSLRVPSSMKSDDGLDSICAAGNATRPDPQSPSTDAPPRAAVEGVKTEQDVAEYPAAPREPSGGFGFAEDLSASSAASAARHEPPAPAAPKSPLVADSDTGSYGLVFSHAALGRRLGYGRGVRAALDARRHKQAPRREEQHVCAVCGKTFSRVGNLRIHQRCHTGEKPYHCPQCGRCFSQAGDLKKHKRVHTGEKPYYCGQCGKSFSRGENLKRHQKIHIGESLHPQQAWTEPPAS